MIRQVSDIYGAGMSAEPVYWGDTWWWIQSLNTEVDWMMGHYEPYPTAVEVEAFERNGAKKKFCIPAYVRFIHLEYGWQPYDGEVVKQFHMVMYREGRDSVKLYDCTEHTSEKAALEQAEEAARRYPAREFFVMTAVSRTKTNNTITERLCPC